MKNLARLIFAFVVFLAVACGKEQNLPEPGKNQSAVQNGQPCQLLQDSSSFGNVVQQYSYDDLGNVIRIDRSNTNIQPLFITLEYDNAGQLIRTNNHAHTSQLLYQYFTYQYNSSGQISQVSSFFIDSGTFQPDGHTTFSYDANGNMVEKNYYITQPSFGPKIKWEFIHLPNGTVVKKEYHDFMSTGKLELLAIFENVLDTKMNPYSGVSNAIENYEFTAHNLLSTKKYDATYRQVLEEFTYSYQYNPEGFPTKQTVKSNLDATVFTKTFKYSCQ